MRATQAVVHLENLRHNIRALKRLAGPDIRMCLAVKADAYGHGAVRVARAAAEEGVEAFGVATVEEGIELRRAGFEQPILLYSLTVPEEAGDVVAHGLQPFVADRESMARLNDEAERRGAEVRVHLKIDTGMGRVGCPPAEAADLGEHAASCGRLRLEGVCTHFAVADEQTDRGMVDYTSRQIERFRGCLEQMRDRGVDPRLVHAANSGALLGRPEAHFDMTRPGIMAYGYYPSRGQERTVELKPVMELRTQVVFQKTVPAGTRLSYGLIYETTRRTRIATLPVGYADGYRRSLSNRATVSIRGKRYPVVGRVCMDQCMVDLGPDAPVRLYDTAVLFGPGVCDPDAEEIAGLTGSIPYEVTCLVSKRVPRVYTDEPAVR